MNPVWTVVESVSNGKVSRDLWQWKGNLIETLYGVSIVLFQIYRLNREVRIFYVSINFSRGGGIAFHLAGYLIFYISSCIPTQSTLATS